MENKNKSSIIIIVLFGLIILGLIGFICYDKGVFGKKENSGNNTENATTDDNIISQEGAKDFDLKEAEQILDKFGFNEDLGCGNNIYDRHYSESFKQIMALKKVSDSAKSKKKCSEIYSKKSQYYDAYEGDYGVCYTNKEATLISYEEANKIYKSMYGEEMPKKGFTTTDVWGIYYNMYDYNESLNSFVQLECGGCGGGCAKQIKINKIKSAQTVGDNLIIDVYYYYGGFEQNSDYIHVSTSKGNLDLEASKTKIGTETDKLISSAEKEIEEKYLDKLDVYEVVFTKKEGNYIFKSVTKKVS